MSSRVFKFRTILVVATVVLSAFVVAEDSGSIHGTVLDAHNKPLAAAKVTATLVAEGRSLERFTQSDDHGSFALDHLPLGSYSVTGEKIDAGYPDSGTPFYGGDNSTRIVLSEQMPAQTTTIKLSGPTGEITGTVVDDVSSQPVSPTFLLRRADDSTKFVTIAQPSAFSVLVPAGVAFTLEISTPAYKTWYYPGTGDPAKKTTLSVKAGQPVSLKIRLQRDVQNCACLDRPSRWGLGPDSPDFQLRGPGNDTTETLRCNKTMAGMSAAVPVLR